MDWSHLAERRSWALLPRRLTLLAASASLVGFVVAPQLATASGAGSFSPTGSMGAARYAAVAAPLKDGRVLVAGGYYDDGGDHYLASAEVFNPATNAFTPVGDMGIARVRAAAAPLPDGRVLVAGGNDGTTRLSSAEVFNPATNAFTPVNDIGTDRARAAAAPLPDGRVLVAGGTNGAPLSSAAVFNPATNSFSSAGIGAMGTARTGAAAAPLPDGRVLVAGGFDGSTRFSSAEIFAATNTFSFRVKRRKLIVRVQASGKVAVVDAASPLSASAAKKKRRRLLKPSSGSGDPPKITVPLRLTKVAKSRLKKKGKVTVRARITFTPQGGLVNTQKAKLKIKRKSKKKK